MASSPFLQQSNQVCYAVSNKIHGRSKAHLGLKKIIEIISSGSSLKPCENLERSSVNLKFEYEAKGSREKARALLDIDLNLRLGPTPETIELEGPAEIRGFSACSGVGETDGKVCRIVIDCNSSAISGDVSTADKSSEGECDPKEFGNSSEIFPVVEGNKGEEEEVQVEVEEEEEAVEEETREFSEITNLQVQSFEIDNERFCEEAEDGDGSEIKVEEEQRQEKVVEEHQEKDEKEDEKVEESRVWRSQNKGEGYLGLLVEAARLISGNFQEEDEPAPEKLSRSGQLRRETSVGDHRRAATETTTKESNKCGSKRNQSWMMDLYGGFEDISPVVRSKRGRNQVLPSRYRDSVLEPWKRLSRQRSTRVSTKQKPT